MVGSVPLWIKVVAVAIIATIALFMLIPLAVVVGSSISASEFLVFPPKGLSIRWYSEVVQSEAYLSAGWISLKLALITVSISLFIGTGAAIALTLFSFPGGQLLSAIFLSPLILPSLIFAIGLLMVFSTYADGPSFTGLVTLDILI